MTENKLEYLLSRGWKQRDRFSVIRDCGRGKTEVATIDQAYEREKELDLFVAGFKIGKGFKDD